MDRKKLVKRLIYLIFFILIANFVASKFYWYSSIWYFDMIMHFLGGFWLGLAFFYLFSFENISARSIFQTLIFILLIGLGWEFFEILVNDVIARNPFDSVDTVADVLLDLSGGLCAILYLYICNRQPR